MSVSEIERGGFKEEVLLGLINETILTTSLLELFTGKVDIDYIFTGVIYRQSGCWSNFLKVVSFLRLPRNKCMTKIVLMAIAYG